MKSKQLHQLNRIIGRMREGFSSQVQLSHLDQSTKKKIKTIIQTNLKNPDLDLNMKRHYERLLYKLYSDETYNWSNFLKKLGYLIHVPKGGEIDQLAEQQNLDDRTYMITKIKR